MPARLTVEGVRAGYGRGDILQDVSLVAEPGCITTIIGPNGSGKSTLSKLIVGLLSPTAGRLLLDDLNITHSSAPARTMSGLAYMPQEANVFLNLSVHENLALAVEFLGPTRRARSAKARELVLDLFPALSECLSRLAGALSGGQRQMLAFGAALMTEPKVMLLDEPSAGLSPKLVQSMFDAVRKVNEHGMTIIMVEQNVRRALKLSHNAVVLAGGQVRMSGEAVTIETDPEIHRLYLGGRA